VRAAISHNSEHRNSTPLTSAKKLHEDLVNIPKHIYGKHDKCKDYFCKGGGDNIFETVASTPAGKDLIQGFHLLANRSHKLIADTTSNRAELFMSIINKVTSGKRVNYAQRGGYANRCIAAVLAYNNGAFWPAKTFANENLLCEVWQKALKEANTSVGKKKKKKRWYNTPRDKLKANQDYGLKADQGSMTEEELLLATAQLISSLQVTPDMRDKIERETVDQSFSDEWKFQRRNRITASNAGKIFNLRDETNNSGTLRGLLYPTDLSHNENIIRGINMEPRAKEVYSYEFGVEVEDCGLFISLENGVLAASPDGLIGTDGLLEIKSSSCKPTDILKRKSSYLMIDKETKLLKLKKTHSYYFQVIQQIYITDRKYCDFFVYYESDDSETCDFHVERICKSKETDEIWTKMKCKLLKFFELDVAPEIVDPKRPKDQPFRQPQYRELAIREKETRKANKLKVQ